ncbi:hypothetical protein K438DRAFT_1755724 [Mycena galopus ATCC 62051]|nr:hypothetical protein K438DRAFT_1755724 [Mycena galopus ATCC 62051]
MHGDLVLVPVPVPVPVLYLRLLPLLILVGGQKTALLELILLDFGNSRQVHPYAAQPVQHPDLLCLGPSWIGVGIDPSAESNGSSSRPGTPTTAPGQCPRVNVRPTTGALGAAYETQARTARAAEHNEDNDTVVVAPAIMRGMQTLVPLRTHSAPAVARGGGVGIGEADVFNGIHTCRRCFPFGVYFGFGRCATSSVAAVRVPNTATLRAQIQSQLHCIRVEADAEGYDNTLLLSGSIKAAYETRARRGAGNDDDHKHNIDTGHNDTMVVAPAMMSGNTGQHR